METGGTFRVIPGSDGAFFRASLIALFAGAAFYAYCILTADKSFHSFITIAFLAALFCVFLPTLRAILRADDADCAGALPGLILYALALHLALLLGFYLSGRPMTALWVVDSHAVHIPGAVNVANFIHGKEALVSIDVPFDRIFLTQTLVGIFFSVLGVNPLASTLALMLAKLLTTAVLFRLGKTLFNGKTAAAGALIYVFSPTILYYTTVFYKEAIVQLLVSAVLLASLKIFLKPGSLKYWLLLVISLYAVMNERFYLFFFFMATFIPLIVVAVLFARKAAFKAVFFGVSALALPLLYVLANKYMRWINGVHGTLRSGHYYLSSLQDLRRVYNGFSDVTPINSTLSYPLAFLKIMFTPFFTLNKFALFSDYTYIFIWGSFINQAVILLSLYGMYRALRADWKKNWFLIFPYFLFLCVFAYVAPYIGRLRDSFYPLIAVYAAYALTELYPILPQLKARLLKKAPAYQVR